MARRRLRWPLCTKLLAMVMAGGLAMLILKQIFTISVSSNSIHPLNSQVARPQSPPETKVVLMHSFPSYYELQSGGQVFASCEEKCLLTVDKGMASIADSIVLFTHSFQLSNPFLFSPKAALIYFCVESPIYSNNGLFWNSEWHYRFNWTMTYRRDSDFYFGYGTHLKASSLIQQRNFSSVAQGKSKMVAWFASNCQTHSKREDYVAALKEFVAVDVYGKCGTLTCDRNGGQPCTDMLSKDYYFYLSFENSMCKDYVTEKLYHIMKKSDVIPVVRGGANYSALLPRNSFIDVSQFPTVKALAEHLKRVAEDKNLYKSYLAWKNEWRVVEPMPFPWCELCHRLHGADRWAHMYSNVDSWWREGICHEAPAIIKS